MAASRSPTLAGSPIHQPVAPIDEWQAVGEQVGRRVLVFDQLESTNTYAASLASDPTNAGVVVLAREQTAGRGQHGRSWRCPREAGVLLSALLFPPAELRRPVLLTAWAAVAVCETVRQVTGQVARIKWPNDVLVQDRKICGILIEQGKGTVAGIGLNINQSAQDFEAAGLQATSLALLTGQTQDWRDIACRLIAQLDAEYRLLLKGDRSALESRWKCHLGLLGRSVRAQCHGGETHQGRLVEIGWDGVQLERGGDCLTLQPERVLHLEMWSSP